jgi:phage baseplate assembly protein W
MQDSIYGSDIKLRMGLYAGFYGIGADLYVNRKGDVDIVSGRENLGQAIIHRLMTRQGELEELGYPEYGSNLHELIGRPNNLATQNMVKLYVNQCLSQEIRIEKIESIDVMPHGSDPHAVVVEVAIIPIGSENPLGISFPYRLEVE